MRLFIETNQRKLIHDLEGLEGFRESPSERQPDTVQALGIRFPLLVSLRPLYILGT